MTAFFLIVAIATYLIFVSHQQLPAGIDDGPIVDSMVLGSADLALIKKSSIDGEEENRNIQNRRVAVLDSDWLYCDANKGVIVRVMDKYITDFASIPFPFSLLLSPSGNHSEAAILHDWLYAVGEPGKRAEADLYFYEAMRHSGVSWPIRRIMYGAVRKFGADGYGRETEWNDRFYEKSVDRKLPKSCLPPRPTSATISLEDVKRANYGSLYREGSNQQSSFGQSKVTSTCASSFFDIRPKDLANTLSSDYEWSSALRSPECMHDLGVIATGQIVIESREEGEPKYNMPVGVFFRSHGFASEKARCFNFESIITQQLMIRRTYHLTQNQFSFRELGLSNNWEAITKDTQHFCTEKGLFDLQPPTMQRHFGEKNYQDGMRSEFVRHVEEVVSAEHDEARKELLKGYNTGIFVLVNATCEGSRDHVLTRLMQKYSEYLTEADLSNENIELWSAFFAAELADYTEYAAELFHELGTEIAAGETTEEDIREQYGRTGVMAVAAELSRQASCNSVGDVNDYFLYQEMDRRTLIQIRGFNEIRELQPVLLACASEVNSAKELYAKSTSHSETNLILADAVRRGAKGALDLPIERVNEIRFGLHPDQRLIFDIARKGAYQCDGRTAQ